MANRANPHQAYLVRGRIPNRAGNAPNAQIFIGYGNPGDAARVPVVYIPVPPQHQQNRDQNHAPVSEILSAVKNRDLEAVKRLLRDGHDFGLHRDHHYCVHYAVAQGSLEMVELLLEVGPNLRHRENWPSYYTAMQAAVWLNDRETRWRMVIMLTEAGLRVADEPRRLSTSSSKFSTCVHRAVTKNDFDLVQLFVVSHGADLNCLDSSGNSPLCKAMHLETTEASIEMIKQLTEFGANVNFPIRSYKTCLHYAASMESGKWELIKVLLDAGAELNWLDNHRVSPLGAAASYSKYEMVQKLIEFGADVNASKRCSASPLELAIRSHNKDIVELLLKSGADIKARDYDGRNILHCAVENTHENKVNESIEILVTIFHHGATVRHPEYGRYAPFQAVLRCGTLAVMELFLERGIQLEECGVQFPLHLAAMNKNVEILEHLLVKLPHDIDQIDATGRTTLFTAFSASNFACFRLLIEWAADVDIPIAGVDSAVIQEYRNTVSHTVPAYSSSHAGRTIFEEAILKRKPEYLDLILLGGASLRKHMNRLDSDYIRYFFISEEISKCLIKQLALLKCQNYINIESDDDKRFMNLFLDNYVDCPVLIDRCSAELEELKTTRLYGSLTLYDLLIGKDFMRFINNRSLIETYESLTVSERFTFYGSQIQLRYLMACRRAKFLNVAKVKLRKLLGLQFYFCDNILYDIIRYLPLKDLCILGKI